MSFDNFPDEIIQHILSFLPAEDNLATFQRLSHRLCRIARTPLLWRAHCRTRFRFWDPDHEFSSKLAAPPSDTDWMQLFLFRKSRNTFAARILNDIVELENGRVRRYGEIARLGYDAKDFLIEQSRVDPAAQDALARSYHSLAILNSIHRGMAVAEWQKAQRTWANVGLPNKIRTREPDIRLERLLGAFDMFVLYDQFGDVDDISAMLDDLARRFRTEIMGLPNMTTRQRAVALNRWLRANGFAGMQNSGAANWGLRHYFMGQTLRRDDHGASPFITCAIFSCVAGRIGLDSSCCLVPGRVHSKVIARPGEILDSIPTPQGTHPASQSPNGNGGTHPAPRSRSDYAGARPAPHSHSGHGENLPQDLMYVDTFGNDDEVSWGDIRNTPIAVGLLSMYLEPAGPSGVARHAAGAIQTTVTQTAPLPSANVPTALLAGNPAMNRALSLYASQWAMLMLPEPLVPDHHQWNRTFTGLLQLIAKFWPGDAWLVEKYLGSIYATRIASVHNVIPGALHNPRPWITRHTTGDDWPRAVHRRTGGMAQAVKYEIGQPFRHKRYGWLGIISGWDTRESWASISDMSDSTGSLADSPSRVYYKCMKAGDLEKHVLAQESVEPLSDPNEIPHDQFPWAGRYFRRFDAAACKFISNIKSEYPDD